MNRSVPNCFNIYIRYRGLGTLGTLGTLVLEKKIFFFNWVNITIYVKRVLTK